MGEEFYRFTLGREQRVRTFVVVCVLALGWAIAAFSLVILASENPALLVAVWASWVALIILPLVLLAMPLFAPKGAVVSADGIAVVRRNGKRIFLPRDEILSVEAKDASVFKDCMRPGTTRWYYGSWGRFYSPTLKWFRGYITNEDSLVGVHTRTLGLVILSPDDRDRFVRRANEVLGLSR